MVLAKRLGKKFEEDDNSDTALQVSTTQLCDIVNIDAPTFNQWCMAGMFPPTSGGRGTGSRKTFGVHHLVAAIYANEWRKHKIGMGVLAQIINYLVGLGAQGMADQLEEGNNVLLILPEKYMTLISAPEGVKVPAALNLQSIWDSVVGNVKKTLKESEKAANVKAVAKVAKGSTKQTTPVTRKPAASAKTVTKAIVSGKVAATVKTGKIASNGHVKPKAMIRKPAKVTL